MAIRDPSPSEVRAFSLIDSLLRRTQPKIRRGVLSEIRIPSGTLARASSGRLSVYANLTTLSTDTLTDRDRRKPRDADAVELQEWRRVSLVIERFQPALRNGRLQEIVIRDGLLRLAPSGELMAITTTDTPMVADIEVPEEVEPEIDIDLTLAEYREEMETEAAPAPFVAVEERAEQWKPPALPRRSMMRSSDFPTASRARSVRAGKQRCPQCKGGLKANAAIQLHLAKGGAIRDVAGRKQTALGMLQVELWSEPRSFVGSSAFAGQRRRPPSAPAAPAPPAAPRITAVEMAARLTVRAEPLAAEPLSP